MAMNPRKCGECGAVFVPVRGNQAYCSDACRVQHRRDHPKCARCGSDFIRHGNGAKRLCLSCATTHKRCPCCALVLPLEDFGRDSRASSGVSAYCRACNAARVRQHPVSPEARRVHQSAYRERHAERLRLEYREKYYDPAKERARKAKRRRGSVKVRIDESMAAQINAALHGKKAGRSWPALVGYSVDELMAHLAEHLEVGMTWENFGRTPTSWSIHHVIPKSRFDHDSTDSQSFRDCWALENLRPMWWPENHAKGNRVPPSG